MDIYAVLHWVYRLSTCGHICSIALSIFYKLTISSCPLKTGIFSQLHKYWIRRCATLISVPIPTPINAQNLIYFNFILQFALRYQDVGENIQVLIKITSFWKKFFLYIYFNTYFCDTFTISNIDINAFKWLVLFVLNSNCKFNIILM